LKNRAAVEALLEPRYRYIFFARLAAGGRELATAEKLAAYAEANVPVSARGDITRAISEIRDRAKVIKDRVPDIDRWIAAHGSIAP
jgi:aminopeptidase N